MLKTLFKSTFGACILAAAAMAQQEPKTEVKTDVLTIAGPATDITMQVNVPPLGGVGHTVEFLSSEMGVAGKPVKGAPYSAEATTETTQTLADGNRISRKSSSLIYRDTEGRTRREVSMGAIGPWASADTSKLVFIHDPVANVSYTLNEKDQTARKMEGNAMVVSFSHAIPGERFEMPVPPPAGDIGGKVVERRRVFVNGQKRGPGEAAEPVAETEDVKIVTPAVGAAMLRVPGPGGKEGKSESLGKRDFGGVQAEGTRLTHTIAAGEIGNDRPINIVFERWYSPELQTVVLTRQSDPRMGETVYQLSSIRRSEPARQLFQVPSNYTVIDDPGPAFLKKLRKPAPAK